MATLQGIGASRGVAIGTVFIKQEISYDIEKREVCSEEEELARLEGAKDQALSELADLYEQALAEVGENEAAIFEVHQMMSRTRTSWHTQK